MEVEVEIVNNVVEVEVKNYIVGDSSGEGHTHANKSILDQITEAFTTALKTNYDSAWTWVSTNAANILSHLANKSNPHEVTAAQLGVYTRDEIDTVISNEASARTSADTNLQNQIDDKIGNDTDGFATPKVLQIVTLTQVEYDGLTPDANTLYVIV